MISSKKIGAPIEPTWPSWDHLSMSHVTPKRAFSEWLREQADCYSYTLKHIGELSGVGKSTISNGLNGYGVHGENTWAIEHIMALCKSFGIVLSEEEILERFEFKKVPSRPRKLKDATLPPSSRSSGQQESMKDVFVCMDEAQANGSDEDFVVRLFGSIRSVRPSFLVTMTGGRMPPLFKNLGEFEGLRDSVKSAIRDRGLRIAFLVPNQAILDRLVKYGLTGYRKTHEEYELGYKRFFAEEDARGQTRLIACEFLDIASPQYVTSLIGESIGDAMSVRRVLERGPGTRSNLWAIPFIDGRYESEIVRYTARIMREHHGDEFTEQFLARMGVE